MTDIDKLKSAIVDICKEKGGKDVLLAVNNKRSYQDISKKTKVHDTKCSRILNTAKTFGLVIKEGIAWKKTPEFRYINIKKTLKEKSVPVDVENIIKVKSRRKKTNTDQIKREIKEYFSDQYTHIHHPFSEQIKNMSKADLNKASDKLFEYLEIDGPVRLNGLANRFYESFSAYFSSNRMRKNEVINNFRNLIGCFEPYVKKVVAIKTKNPAEANPSLSKEMISKIISFTSDLNKTEDNYWTNKPIHEASIRIIFPYRHIESHEARDYTLHQMDKIIFYLFASIIFINLDY